MNIQIKPENLSRIQQEIDKVQKRSRVRCINVQDIVEDIKLIEYKLGISKKAMVGVIARIDHNAQGFPGSYKGIPESTHVTIEKKAAGWNLIQIERSRTETRRFSLTLTEEAKKAIIEECEYFM